MRSVRVDADDTHAPLLMNSFKRLVGSQSRSQSHRYPCPATVGQGNEDSGDGVGEVKSL